MSSIGVFEAKNRLTALIDEVERRGTEVVITRRGRPVAKLAPIDGSFDRRAARAAADGLREVSRGLTLGGLSIRELTEHGRR